MKNQIRTLPLKQIAPISKDLPNSMVTTIGKHFLGEELWWHKFINYTKSVAAQSQSCGGV